MEARWNNALSNIPECVGELYSMQAVDIFGDLRTAWGPWWL